MITWEVGRPLAEARAEVEKCAASLRGLAAAGPELLAATHISESAFVNYDPLGVILAVMPWNFPFRPVLRFAALTLIAGDAGLFKHASTRQAARSRSRTPSSAPRCGAAAPNALAPPRGASIRHRASNRRRPPGSEPSADGPAAALQSRTTFALGADGAQSPRLTCTPWPEIGPRCTRRKPRISRGFRQIGETGFEPATARPPAGCATRLRHSPLFRRPKRATGIEPALRAWKAPVQPQHFARGRTRSG